MTQMKTIVGDLSSKLNSMKLPEGNALSSGAEASLISADEKLKYLTQDLQSPTTQTIATIPSEVTNNLAIMQTDTKPFAAAPKHKSAIPPSSTATQAARLLARTPSYETAKKNTYNSAPVQRVTRPTADRFGAGDDNNAANQDITEAVNRVKKNMKKAKQQTKSTPLFHDQVASQSEDFKQLAKRMQSLETSLQHIPTMAQVQEQQQKAVNARNTIQGKLTVKESSADAPQALSTSHSDITAKKVELMNELVSNLDELGRFFGEDEIIDEDDNISIKEDPKIALVEGNLAAAAGRIQGDLHAQPDRFADDYRLHDIEHYLSNPVPASHTAPTADNTNDNLNYLRNLRNYVVSMKEKENRY
jgi:hypothetical protein